MDGSDFNKFKGLLLKLAQNCNTTIPESSLEWRFKDLSDCTFGDVEYGINYLIQKRDASRLPSQGEIRKWIVDARKKDLRGLVKVPCPKCDGIGYLWLKKDHPYWKEYGSLVAGCGCTNTPSWMKTAKQYIEDKMFAIEDFIRRDERIIVDSEEEHIEKLHERNIRLWKKDCWVPKWMRERFEAGNFELPSKEDYPRPGKETKEQFNDCPF